MAATLLGPDALKELLAAHGHVLVANRTTPEQGVTIVAVAVARHHSGGAVHSDTIFGLELGADESVGLDPVLPQSEEPTDLEVLLRLRVEPTGALVDAYAVLARPAGATVTNFEVGVKPNTGLLEEGEETVEGFAHLVVYGTPPKEGP